MYLCIHIFKLNSILSSCQKFTYCIVKYLSIHWSMQTRAPFLYPGGIGFPIQGSHVQIYWVAPRSTQPFILPRSIKWVPGISGNWVVKSKLPHRSGTSLEAVETHPYKGAIKFFSFFFSYVKLLPISRGTCIQKFKLEYIAFKLSSKMNQNSMFCYSSLLIFWY